MRIQTDSLEHLIEAYYAKEQKVKAPLPRAANPEIETMRHQRQICTEMRFLSPDQLQFATRALTQIGLMVGGWIRQQEGRA